MSGQTTTLVLCLGIALSAGLGIAGYYIRKPGAPPSPMVYVFRPLAGILILALALAGDRAADPRLYWALAAGLLFALLADILLMLPQDLFVYGLAVFALTHVCFLVAFTSRTAFAAHRLPFAVFALAGAAVVASIWRCVGGKLKVPVVVYVALLVSMASQAWSRHLDLGAQLTLLAAWGGAIFLCSDAILSIDTFKKPFRSARIWVLGTFYLADTLIALSVPRLGG